VGAAEGARTRVPRGTALLDALMTLVDDAITGGETSSLEQDAVRWSRRAADPAEVVALVGQVRRAAPCTPAREDVLQRIAMAAVTAVSDRQVQAALTDPLTGLATRARMEQDARHLVAVSVRDKRPLTAVIIDVDGLKRINDEQGHAAGDAALADVGRAIREHIRRTDRAFRWGGDEFVLLMPGTTEQGARLVVERIQRAAATPTSAGLSQHRGGEDAVDILTWLSEADAELYRHRRSARASAVPTRRRQRLPRSVAVTLSIAAAAVGGVAATAAARSLGIERPVLHTPLAAPAIGSGAVERTTTPGAGVREVAPVPVTPVLAAVRGSRAPVTVPSTSGAPALRVPAVTVPKVTPPQVPSVPELPDVPVTPVPGPSPGLLQRLVNVVGIALNTVL